MVNRGLRRAGPKAGKQAGVAGGDRGLAAGGRGLGPPYAEARWGVLRAPCLVLREQKKSAWRDEENMLDSGCV